MKRHLFLVSTAVFALGLCGAASAQQAGGYAGTSADGQTISLTVTGTPGDFTITGMSVGFSAACKNPGGSVNEGWGFFLGETIMSGANNFTSHNDYYYITGSLHFPNNNQIKGTITSYTATFVPGSTPPAKSQFCVSPKQAFTLNFTGADAKAPVEPGTAITGK